ncbi:MAG TPA: YebC/PmpR family DNA-binding transcriptional regulator [Firmicutes bacterium]|nr:YebC/PmpR family DNA-binding transcriptional regulator [Bacillota bacterium]
MSGHSKWANIKNRKEKQDAQRGKAFTRVTREIMIAAREGGPDPVSNFRLRMAIEKAKEVNMPNDNIQRAIKRGAGLIEGEAYEEVLYEGYGPGGVAIMLDIFTDNRNRTASEIRHLFSRYGGNLGESGCVAWMFDQKGLLVLERDQPALAGVSEDDVMMAALEAGAEDFSATDDAYEIITPPEAFSAVQESLDKTLKVKFAEAEVTMIPKNMVELGDKESQQLAKLVAALEEHDDVQNVYLNAELPEEASA